MSDVSDKFHLCPDRKQMWKLWPIFLLKIDSLILKTHYSQKNHCNDKVNRCLARYSPRHNHQPTHQQGTKWASNGQKCQYGAKFGRFWAKNLFFYWRNQKFCYLHKVNRCLARYSPRATTTNRPTNRALNKPAWPGPNWPKMPVLGQIWSFLGKKSFFLLEKSKVLLPT